MAADVTYQVPGTLYRPPRSGSSNVANTNASSSQSPSSPIYLRESIDVDLGTHTLCRPESISSPETCFSDDHQQASPPKLLPPQIEEARISPSSVDFGHYLHYDMQLEIGELSNSGDLFIQDMMPELNEQPERVAMPESINQPVPLSPKTLNIQSSSASHGDGNQQEFAGDEGGRNLDVAFVRLFQSSGRSSPVGCLALDKSLEFASSLPRVGERDLREYWLSYSTTFHKIMPVIHMGSLEFDPSPSLLLSTIAAIGADSLTGDGPQGYASATYEKLFSFLAAPTDCSRAECPKCLLLLAAKCLLCYRILDHRNLLFFNAALELISHLTVEAARLGLFAVRDIDLMPQEEFSPREDTPIPRSSDANIRNTTELITTAVSQDEIPKWRKWVSNEQQKRLGWAVFAADHLSSLLTNRPSQIPETDLKISSPCIDAFWDARNAKEWRSLFPWTPAPPTPLPFAGIVRNIILGEFPLKKLSDFNLDLCIFAFEMAVLGLGGSHIMGMHELQLKSLPVRTKLLQVLALLKSKRTIVMRGYDRL
ncbi:uncharacterized protein PV07_10317 [Cladophialophora immunda]|uniref:Xylanolytic transcriptional activator regulatory domain-containing protein n=1 Tax=Cladophialophora immunda TaxID=569365 RepID=A0A0D2AI95_9EURO|nr:uncharacterized protein PV07_10317 [Cladophialophora immunda]KIW24612.1 hypothetical protein PV07_10317 [Cladophialophora immunda]